MENYIIYWSLSEPLNRSDISPDLDFTDSTIPKQDAVTLWRSIDPLAHYRFAPIPPEILSFPEHLQISQEARDIVMEAYNEQYIFRKDIAEELSSVLGCVESQAVPSVQVAASDCGVNSEDAIAESSRSGRSAAPPESLHLTQSQQIPTTIAESNHEVEQTDSEAEPPSSTEILYDCTACGDSFREHFMHLLPCTHRYCNLCFQQLVTVACRSSEDFPPQCCQLEVPPDLIHQHTTITPKPRLRFRRNRPIHMYLLSSAVRCRYAVLVREASIPAAARWYCPAAKCNQPFDHRAAKHRLGSRTALRCPACSTSICTRCRTHHARARACPDAALAATLAAAARHGWQRCPACRALVELTDGCRHMRCRCGAEFCYTCCRRWRFPMACADSNACAVAHEARLARMFPAMRAAGEGEVAMLVGAYGGGVGGGGAADADAGAVVGAGAEVDADAGVGEDAELQRAIIESIQSAEGRAIPEQRGQHGSLPVIDQFVVLGKELASLRIEQRILLTVRHERERAAGMPNAKAAEWDHQWLTAMARKRLDVLGRREMLFRVAEARELVDHGVVPETWI